MFPGRNPFLKSAGRVLAVSLAAIMGIWGGAVQSLSQTPDPETVVRQRMTAYWDAMQRNDYETASNYIHPDSRKLFIFRVPKATVVRWKIQSLKFNADKTVCDTVTIVGRPIPIPIEGGGNVPDLPLDNQWVLASDGQWYLKLPWKDGENPLLDLYKAEDSASGKVVYPGEPPKVKSPLGGEVPSRLVPDPGNPQSIHSGERAIYRFHYKNDSTIPIKILSAHGDCHCTAVQQDNPVIPPGESGVLEITVDTFGLPFGLNRKMVSVQFSDMKDPVNLALQINAVPNFTISPPAVDFGVMLMGTPAEKKVRIVNNSGRIVKILSVLKAEPQLSVQPDKAEIGPGDALTVTLRCTPAEAGEIRDSPMLRTDLAAEPLINIPVRGVIRVLKAPEF